MDKKYKILIADDEYANVFLLENMLKADYDIIVANDGLEALDKISEHDPDLILLDIMMPKMSGIEVCKKLNEEDNYSDIPIIVVTAKSDVEDIREGLEAGAFDYITKPISEIELIARIRVALRFKNSKDILKDTNDKLFTANKEKDSLIAELEDALAQVKTLSGLLPVCANCKKIRDDKGYWNSIESYFAKHTDMTLTHGLCPNCKHDLYPELYAEDEDGA